MRKISDLLKSLYRKPFIIGSIFFLIFHVILLILTLISHAFPIFIWQNVAGILFMTGVWLMYQFHPLDKAISVLLIVLFCWGQIHIAILAVGVTAGFQNYFFATLATAFFLTYSTRTDKTTIISAFLELGSLAMYLMSVLHGEKVTPVYTLPEFELYVMNIINSVFSLLAITFFADSYRYKLKSSVNSLKQAANFDELTELFNRRGIRPYFDMLQKDWELSGKAYMVAIIDIDDFKEVNDTWGHNEGDKVLVLIGGILSDYIDRATWVCRWGGEEFLIVSQMNNSKTVNMNVLNRILGDIRKASIPEKDTQIQVTVTIGCAFSEPDLMIHELINKADNALYRGKSSGKNQIVYAD